MERLTKRVEEGNAVYYLYGFGAFDELEALEECVDRLAAYEDTMPLERAQELAQAEKDGRLVVLPVPNRLMTLDRSMIDDALTNSANAIETLLAERDAAIADLTVLGQDSGDSCHLCKHLPCVDKNGNGHCLGFAWRGPQRDSGGT